MPAYLIANVAVKQIEKMKEYFSLTPDLIKKYGGEFLVWGGDFWIAEGDWAPRRMVMVKFKSMEKAKAFWHSEEYAPVRAIRQAAAYTEMIFVEGIDE